jgi:hypothetical protein
MTKRKLQQLRAERSQAMSREAAEAMAAERLRLESAK